MSSSEIKIFYSWQSDLPGNQTRYLIQDSIDATVKAMRDTIEIIADRDTKGEFGSPDIAQTIFSKIDECDIFVADVSIINKFYSIDENGKHTDDIKATPNPNVLLELGYAAHALGWENVICIINTDFGTVEELPFDLKHRRLTPYSLQNKDKAEVKKVLREIIAATVMNILENGKRVKGTFSNHIVGGYDIEAKKVVKQLIPFDITGSQWHKNEHDEMLSKCRSLIDTINSIKLQPPEKSSIPAKTEENKSLNKEIELLNNVKFSFVQSDFIKNMNTPNLVMFKEDDMKFIKQKAKEWLDIDLSEEFFYVGNLRKKTALLYGESTEYLGTEDEKLKNKKILELETNIYRAWLLDLYFKTFTGMYLFPIAIYNSSTQVDKDISVTVKVKENTADVVLPNANLCNEKIKGFEGLVYSAGVVKKLLMMPETSDIQYDSDISYGINDSLIQMRKIPLPMMENTSPKYDSEDYEREIKKFIASPMDGSDNEIEFYIKDLLPKEKKWLGAAILVKPKSNKVIFSYSIKSQNSNGELSGILEYVFQ